jgi:hypothetical protein
LEDNLVKKCKIILVQILEQKCLLRRPTLLSENVWIVLKQNLSYQVNKLSKGLLGKKCQYQKHVINLPAATFEINKELLLGCRGIEDYLISICLR